MLRTLSFALTAAAFALAAPGAAFAEPRADEVQHLEIRSEANGAVQGRVRNVERNREGRIVSIAADGLEAPADAPPYIMAPRHGPETVIVAEESVRRPDGARQTRGVAAR